MFYWPVFSWLSGLDTPGGYGRFVGLFSRAQFAFVFFSDVLHGKTDLFQLVYYYLAILNTKQQAN